MAVQIRDSAARKIPLVDELRELYRFREFLRLLVINSISTRYKRSVLGVFWTLLNPLLTMTVLTFVFSEIFRSSITHYAVYLLAGIMFWNFFSQTTLFSVSSLVWGAGLLKRTYVPRSIFVVAALGNGLFNLIVTLLPLVVIMILTGAPFYPTWWLLPFAIFFLAVFTLGVGLFISALAVEFVDIVDIYQVAIQILFWMTPIVYPTDALPSSFAWLIKFNPLYHLLKFFRMPIYDGSLPSLEALLAAAGSSLLVLLAGWAFFGSRANRIVYRI